jgi:hypothetical protein
MKAKSLAALAILGATMGMGAVPQAVPTQQAQQQRHNEAVEKTPTTVRQRTPTAINPTGGYTEYLKVGRSPKEYGQWLQYNRMQKWNKGGRK